MASGARPVHNPPAVWQAIFFIGLVFVIIKAFKDPAWLLCGGVYVYFGIPPLEFRVPGAPYAAALFGAAMATSLFYYTLFHKWGIGEIQSQAARSGKLAIDGIKEKMGEALLAAVGQDKLPGEIREAALIAAETPAIDIAVKEAPAAISSAVSRSVTNAITQSLDQAIRELTIVIERAAGQGRTKGNVRMVAQDRVLPVLNEALDKNLEVELKRNIDALLDEDRKESSSKSAARGPLGIPMPQGPIGGLLTNVAWWLHVAFVVLTWYGAEHALYSYEAALPYVGRSVLLLIPISAILLSVRTPEHFKMMAFAWLLGVWHICMNGVNYWLRYGGRADSAGGQGGEANFLGAICVSVVAVAFGLAINAKQVKQKVFFLGVAGCYVLGVLASGSRAGLLAMIGTLGYWLINTTRRGLAVGLVMFAISGFLVVAPASFWVSMGTILGTKDKNPWVLNHVEPSKGERLILWALAIKEFKQHPFMGIGPGNYVTRSGQELDITDAYQGKRGMQAHNTWLQLFCEYGLIGGGVWAGAYFISTLCYFLARRRMKNYPGWEWFGAICLGLEAGSLGTAVVHCFNSFQWYDYMYWHMVIGPLALEIARRTGDRLDWMAPADKAAKRPPPRYGKPNQNRGIALGEIDLAEQAPISFGGQAP